MERLAARGWHNAVSPRWGLEKLHARRFLGSRPRLYDSAPLRGLRNQCQRQRNWDDPFSGASPTFRRPWPVLPATATGQPAARRLATVTMSLLNVGKKDVHRVRREPGKVLYQGSGEPNIYRLRLG
jgi:hypothetical protein